MMIRSFKLSDSIKLALHEYINSKLSEINPYDCDQTYAEELGGFLLGRLKVEKEKDGEALYKLIFSLLRNQEMSIPPVYIKNIAGEPIGTLLQPRLNRGFDYGSDPRDRMKKYFYTEWISWAIALLFRYTNIIHPSEHGGKNRFHMVSPISDENTRTLSASTGGGRFLQHSDATVYTSIDTAEGLEKHLNNLGTSSSIAADVLGLSVNEFSSQVLCGKYSKVDATMLSGIVNKNTKTLITTPKMLQNYLEDNFFTKDDFRVLSTLPIAHIAGPADGDISGFVGNIVPPVTLTKSGNIFGTCINLAPDRMVYVGNKKDERNLFEKFCFHATNCPNIEVVIESSDILLFPNLTSRNQFNVTHGRENISSEAYEFQVEGVMLRRNLCRQYLVRCPSTNIKELHFGAD